jgi:hypothetical protein
MCVYAAHARLLARVECTAGFIAGANTVTVLLLCCSYCCYHYLLLQWVCDNVCAQCGQQLDGECTALLLLQLHVFSLNI